MLNSAQTEALRIDAEQYAAAVTCSIFQRNDGVQLALDSSCDVRFIRTSKNGEWFKAGFRNSDMEGYQPVDSDVVFTSMPSRTLSYSDGVMVVYEAWAVNEKELTDLFMARTGEDSEVAQKYLEMNYWSLSTALTF